MSKNLIENRIKEERAKDRQTIAEMYQEFFEFLDTLEISNNDREKISEFTNRLAYYFERAGLQQGVEAVNKQLSATYWACRPYDTETYLDYYLQKNYERKVNA